jgi:hypothetical protein
VTVQPPRWNYGVNLGVNPNVDSGAADLCRNPSAGEVYRSGAISTGLVSSVHSRAFYHPEGRRADRGASTRPVTEPAVTTIGHACVR